MSEHAEDAQFRETSGALATVEPGSPMAEKRLDRDAIVAKHEDFEWLKARFLDRQRHIYVINGKDRVNSAGWEHLAMCLAVSVTFPQGPPQREIVTAANGKQIVTFTAFVRATLRDRTVERSGRCDSTESKHNQYEHKMEQVASTRAANRAVAILIGGAESDVGDDTDPAPAAEIVERVPVKRLKELATRAGVPDFREFLAKNIPSCADYERKDCQRPLTPQESVEAATLLSSMAGDAAITQDQIARIHILAKEAGLPDSSYRALLLRVTQKPSSTQLTRAEADAVITELLTVQQRTA